jgi:hypothetical protein
MTNSKSTYSFPHPELTLIDGHPTPLTLTKLHSAVYDDAMSVLSKAGGSIYGNLGVIMPDANCL